MAVYSISSVKWMFFYIAIYTPVHSFTHATVKVSDGEQNEGLSKDVVWLKPNEQHLKKDSVPLKIYCYRSVTKTLLQIWRSVHLTLDNAPLSYDIFPGVNESDVHAKYDSQSIWHPSSWISGQKTQVDFPSFLEYCVGISSKEQYAISLQVRTANYWKLLQTIIGLMLFLSAPSLSRNPFFHYTSAVSLGVVGSLLVLIYVLSRFIPKKSTSYAVLIFGYSFILYLFQRVWKDLHEIVSSYMDLVLAYCLCAAFVSFLVCYRLGPVKNVRTFNIIQWTMQIIAVILIYLSSEYREVSTAIVLILIGSQVIPASWISKFHKIWYRFFPVKVKLLTELQYIEQGHLETKKSLENLRKFCSSPDCDAWKTVRRLKDPLRFAQFIDTGSHCTDEELLQYHSEDFNEFDEEDDSDTENFDNQYTTNNGNSYPNNR